MVTNVSALTATILTPKTVNRFGSPGTLMPPLGVRNDNDHSVTVTVSGFDNQILTISNPQIILDVGQEANFVTIISVIEPINKTYSLQVMFTDENQSVSLNAKWVVLSEFVVTPVTVPEPEPTPTHSSGGGSHYVPPVEPKEQPTCKTAYDCFDTNNLVGCRRDDCNWCCYTVCTLVDCGHTEQPALQRGPEVQNITQATEGSETLIVHPPKIDNTLLYVMFGIFLMCIIIFFGLAIFYVVSHKVKQ